VFNGLRYILKTGAPWRWMSNDLPPWAAVYQQTQRWLEAGCFEALADDLRVVLRLGAGRKAEPSAAILDSRTLRSSPESGERAGYDGAKRKKGSKLHLAVDTLGHLLALHVTPANAEHRAQVGRWPKRCRRPPAAAWTWPMSTRATQASGPKRPPRRTISPLKGSNCRTQKRAL
jgi:transposase